LPFFCVFLIFVPKRLTWPLVILSIISIGQMIIAAASNVLVPDWMVVQISTLRFFEFSTIYNYCLVELVKGHFTRNLGQVLLSLNSWSSLVPLLVVSAGITSLFFWEQLAPRFRKLEIKPG
jgi:hypothetical protein